MLFNNPKNRITFVPVGGLGNRIRSMVAAIRLASACGSRLRILWFQDWGMPCPFNQLFSPIDLDFVEVKEATWVDLWLRDRPRRKNFCLPYLYEKLCFDACLYEGDTKKDTFDFYTWAKGRNVFLASFHTFYKKKESSFFEYFRPTPTLAAEVERIGQMFPPNLIGVQIRRGDHTIAANLSPTRLFVEKMQQNNEAHFLLCTDDEAEKERLQAQFGERIITTKVPLCRTSKEGIQAALVEMFLLARTHEVWGSATSSFGAIAAKLGHIPYTEIRLA